MSEYQYYEFTAVDRPLTIREQGELRSLSTRADITATSFVNTYEWGDFKGDPRKLMERYFDAHLYLANWGTRQLMLRLPKKVLDPATVAGYCVGESAAAWTAGSHDHSGPGQRRRRRPAPALPGLAALRPIGGT